MDRLCRDLADDLDRHFPEVVRLLRADVYSGLRRLHPAVAEDLTQEAFIRAYLAMREYPAARIRELRLRGWIWTIALNLGRNHLRDRQRRPQAVELFDRHGVDDPEPADTGAWSERLGRLSAPQRRAVVLRHVVGLSYADLALALDRPEGTVKTDVSRGLARLRTMIEEEEA